MAVAMWLLSLMDVNTPSWQTGVFIAVLGLGMGFLMQTTTLIARNSVEQKDLGVSSSTSTFFRSIGGSFGVSLFGAVFNNCWPPSSRRSRCAGAPSRAATPRTRPRRLPRSSTDAKSRPSESQVAPGRLCAWKQPPPPGTSPGGLWPKTPTPSTS
ncbi:hypothetical protein [Streptosporangium roseum]|uniref:hypothetical protein n=1 Tax=Streptosporangium roseum TaxID=2001 RepID=UPI0012DC2945|nr:hypothetical protein [Streptosporangium roseum]